MRILKKILTFIFGRLFLVALMLVIQIILLAICTVYFIQIVFYGYLILILISTVAAIGVINNNENPSYKLIWIVVILAVPLTGGVFYLMLGNKRVSKKMRGQIGATLEDTRRSMPSNKLSGRLLKEGEKDLAGQSQYIYNTSGYPVQGDTRGEYYPVGEDMYESMLAELEEAQRFIFLEYFIIEDGVMWSSIFDILKRKVAQGVEVRLMYDDLGTINTLPQGYDRVIRKAGIKLCVFNPFRPRVNILMNHRDHRKICIIDGCTAFCGGINLADEYINRRYRFGHWKDTGVMIKGEGVWSFTFMFLQLWHFSTNENICYEEYRGLNRPQEGDGLVQVFGDTPLDDINVTENAYLNIISRANHYVYITTPYLIIDYEMEMALCTAAQSGVDVRIVTPHIYDKWYVHMLTRSHYKRLVEAGVKIYEYTPGFMHGKMFVSDDKVCMVGTCNMDFRSFYLHFECSVAFYRSSVLEEVKADMLETQDLSQRVTLEDTLKVPFLQRMLRAVLKIFAPLM